MKQKNSNFFLLLVDKMLAAFVSPVLVTAGVSVVFSFCQTEKYFPGAFEGGEKREEEKAPQEGEEKKTEAKCYQYSKNVQGYQAKEESKDE